MTTTSPPTLLDVSALPSTYLYGPEGRQIDLAKVIEDTEPAVRQLMASGHVKKTENFGFAMATFDPGINALHWDDPTKLVLFVAGWGPERERYIANAVRKMRASARTGLDTLYLELHEPDSFRDVVTNEEGDTEFPWGDYTWGGSTFTDFGGNIYLTGVSALTQFQDDALAALNARLIGSAMHEVDNPKTDD